MTVRRRYREPHSPDPRPPVLLALLRAGAARQLRGAVAPVPS